MPFASRVSVLSASFRFVCCQRRELSSICKNYVLWNVYQTRYFFDGVAIVLLSPQPAMISSRTTGILYAWMCKYRVFTTERYCETDSLAVAPGALMSDSTKILPSVLSPRGVALAELYPNFDRVSMDETLSSKISWHFQCNDNSLKFPCFRIISYFFN